MTDMVTVDKGVDREALLGEAVAAYYEAMDRGERVDSATWKARYPEVAEEFSRFFEDQQRLRRLVSPWKQNQEVHQIAATQSIPVAARPREETELHAAAGDEETEHAGAGTEPDEERPGQQPRIVRLDDFELIRRLGQGAMGVVYEARQVSLHRPVALKMIRGGLFATAAELQRFQLEAEAVATLDDPRIVPIYGVGEHEDCHYFTMKLIRGGSLAQAIERFEQDPRAAAKLMIEVARAIHHAHGRGILHRDLKPANILLDEAGQPHVTDFGLAKRFRDDSSLTASGAILGTPSYMAPEQALGHNREITALTDVYGLGAVLYALLTGRPPFTAETVLDTIEQVRTRPPVPPSKLNERVDRDLETICLKCLEKEPIRRYATAEALANDLQRWVDGIPITARPVSAPRRVQMWCLRNKKVTLFLAAVSVFACMSTWQWWRAERFLLEAQRSAVSDSIDQAVESCQEGEVSRGLYRLADTLRQVPRDSQDLRGAIRHNIAAWSPYVTRLKAMLPHGQPVYQARYSADGRSILTISARIMIASGLPHGVARVWDARTGEMAGPPIQGPAPYRMAALSPDGQTIATGGEDGLIRLWQVGTSAPVGEPMRHGGIVTTVAFSPDGTQLISGGLEQTARVWDVHARQPIGAPLQHQDWVNFVAFNVDGTRAITGCLDGRIRLWDLPTQTVLNDKLQMHVVRSEFRTTRLIDVAEFNDRIVTNGLWGAPHLRGGLLGDAARPDFEPVFLPHDTDIRIVAISRDGRTAITAGLDKTSRLWDATTGQPIGRPLRHQTPLWSAALSDNGQFAITGTEDGVAQIWECATGGPIGDPLYHDQQVLDATFHRDGHEVLTASADGTVRIWTMAGDPREQAGKKITVPVADGTAAHIARSPDGRRLLVGHADGTARIRDARTMVEAGTVLKHEFEVRAVAWSPDGRLLVTGCTDGYVHAWSAGSAGLVWRLAAHQGPVRSVSFSPDGRFLATGSEDKTARWIDAATGKPLGPAMLHPASVEHVRFLSDGTGLITRMEDGTCWQWPCITQFVGTDDDLIEELEALTGRELGPRGEARGLDYAAWQRRRARIQAGSVGLTGTHPHLGQRKAISSTR